MISLIGESRRCSYEGPDPLIQESGRACTSLHPQMLSSWDPLIPNARKGSLYPVPLRKPSFSSCVPSRWSLVRLVSILFRTYTRAPSIIVIGNFPVVPMIPRALQVRQVQGPHHRGPQLVAQRVEREPARAQFMKGLARRFYVHIGSVPFTLAQ